jgi:hypothetical protein
VLNNDSKVKVLLGFRNRVAFKAGLIIEDKIKAPEMIIPT